MADKAVIIFEFVPGKIHCDIEVPLDISVEELKNALAQGFQFEWKPEYVLKIENSMDVLEDHQPLKAYSFHDGTVIKVYVPSSEMKEDNRDFWNDSFYEYPQYIKNVRQQYKMLSEIVEVLPPEAAEEEEKKSILLMIMPIVVSLALTIVLRGVLGNGGTFVIYSVAMMTMSSIITLINYRKDVRKREEKKKRRTKQYLQYIVEQEALIKELQEKERVIANRKYTSVTEKIQFVKEFNNRLFEKRKQDEDFLEIRIGEGIVKSGCEIKVKESEYKELNDPLAQCPAALAKKYKYLDKMPVILNLKEVNAVGVVGSRTKLYQLAKNLMLSICIEHYYHDVKIFLIMEEKDVPFFAWARWLQNMRENSSPIRNFMYDEQSAKISLEFLYAELARRESMDKNQITEFPHYIVFVYRSKKIAEHPVSDFVAKASELGFTFIFFENYEEILNENCEKRILLNPNSNEGYIQDVKDGENIQYFHYPHVDKRDAEKAALRLASVYVDEVNLESALTKEISLYEMLGIENVQEINLQKNWEEAQVYNTLAVPIGVKNGGSIVELDLHEKNHGPHGLVAGTTGSGKSEILQTYILSIAMHFHPHEVCFMIIDFKGGGMVNQFKNLPHLIGSITNIDGREIERSLKSIKAELLKRQTLFAEVNVNHIDKYIKMYKEGQVHTPLPHLIIIVDEFAELKAEQPEFMKELISAARIGRSLGVHLILATQKPSGQVNEQIWSNSKFKICLKVQTKNDSIEVIKSPLAAEIKEPGRAYLQVGNNEVFELLQSAYSGASAVKRQGGEKEFRLCTVELSGKRDLLFEQKRKNTQESNCSQLEAVIEYIQEYCKKLNIVKLPDICMPSLAEEIDIVECSEDYSIDSVPIGVYDAPDSQYQGEVKFNFCENNTMIIGASATGKTNLLQTIIRQIAEKASPQEATIYIMDFGTMYLKNFERLHHVGGVVTVAEEEKLKNLFKLLLEEIQNRKEKFLEAGISSFTAYKEAGYKDFSQIFLLVDNFNVFREVYSDSLEDSFTFIIREGLTCGISVIVTNTQTARLGYKYMSNFACRIAFHCNDSSEYSALFERCRIKPQDIPGRALCKVDKVLYEMQVYLAFKGEREIERSEEIKTFVQSVNAKYANQNAKRIPEIPNILSYSYIEDNFNVPKRKYQYPVALDYASVDVLTLDLSKINEFCIVGNEQEKRTEILRAILQGVEYNLQTQKVKAYVFDSVERSLRDKEQEEYVEMYTIDYTVLGEILTNIAEEFEHRYEILVAEGIESLEELPLYLFIVNNRDAIDYISSAKNILEIYNKLTKKYKSLGICFIYTDIEDAPVAFGASELMKRFKENRKTFITTENLKEFKFCEVPSNYARTSKSLKNGDAFWLNGTTIQRVKLIDV